MTSRRKLLDRGELVVVGCWLSLIVSNRFIRRPTWIEVDPTVRFSEGCIWRDRWKMQCGVPSKEHHSSASSMFFRMRETHIMNFTLAEWSFVRGEAAYFSTKIAGSGMRHSLGGWQLCHVWIRHSCPRDSILSQSRSLLTNNCGNVATTWSSKEWTILGV
jgi:hypothetical protein